MRFSRTALLCLPVLLVSATNVLADNNKSTDAAALVSAITERMRNDREFPLENTLESFRATSITEFSGERDDTNETCAWPKLPPAGVTEREWQALQLSLQPEMGEIGCSTYQLVDMNEDGLRDLLQRTYSGGTGLSESFLAFKQEGGRFPMIKGRVTEDTDQEYEQNEVFTLNGRGANQWFELINLNGRSYVAYVDGNFGQDTVSLLRPVDEDRNPGTIRVQYRYSFSVPPRQKRPESNTQRTIELSSASQQSLEETLSRYLGGSSISGQPDECPSPADISEDERDLYRSWGAGHYSFESVADFPVWLDGHCHVARFIDWFGRYSKEEGLFAMLFLRRPEEGDGPEIEVRARRHATAAIVENTFATE